MPMRRIVLSLLAIVCVVTPLLADPPDVVLGPYAYDGSGNIRAIGPTEQFQYDRDGRLLKAVMVPGTQEFTYDPFGNRIASDTTAGIVKCNGGADCTLKPAVSKDTNRIDAVSYDAAGNLKSIDGHDYTWDALGMMTSQHYTQLVQYIYTAGDERIAVYNGSRWEWSIRDVQNRVLRQLTSDDSASAAASSNWTWSADEVFRGASLLAGERANIGRRHFHLDHIGTPRLITTDAGSISGSYEYYAFGPQPDAGAREIPTEELKFTGHQRDLASGDVHVLDYMHARYYDGAVGRFLSVDPGRDWDPHQPQSWNMYTYVRNDPLNKTDPTGKKTTCGKETCTTTADTFDEKHSTGQTTVATEEMRAAAERGVDKVAVRFHDATEEKLGYGVRDTNGNLTVETARGVSTNTDWTGSTARSDVPAGAEFGIHGHIDGGPRQSNGMVDRPDLNGGYGDTKTLSLQNPMPMATVSRGLIGWHEIQNGQLTFTAPVGALTESQQKAIQHNLDSEQKQSSFWKK